MIVDNPRGNYRFIKGIGPFSSGAVAHPGYEVAHAVFHPAPPLAKGYDLIERHLQSVGRPIHALCGMELRIPRPLSFQGFGEFNQPYIKKLEGWGLPVDGLNPVARTNVAIEVNPVPEPSVYGFSYTAPVQHKAATFVMAGAAEVKRFGPGGEREITSRGDVSAAGMRQKAETVLEALNNRLREMGVTWTDVTTVQVYTVHNIHPLMEKTILPAFKGANRYGVLWHYARPPVAELECEMDARAVYRELVLPG